MSRFAVIILSALFLAFTAWAADAPGCGELGCRANGLGYVSPEGGVVIMPGESFSIALKVEGDKIAGFELRKLSADLPNSIELSFLPGMLKLISHVDRMVRAEKTDVESIILAFDEALGKVLKQVVEWALVAPGTTRRAEVPGR